MTRTELMHDWLQQQFPDGGWSIAPASADASFRRYFRVTTNDASHIVMDAPPQHEDCAPFLHVAQIFAAVFVIGWHLLFASAHLYG
mgnify:CR=1 FL=1